MIENIYKRTYVAVPLPDEMAFSWAVHTMRIIDRCRFSEMAEKHNFPHITLYHLGTIDDEEFARLQQTIDEASDHLVGSKIRAVGLKLIGEPGNQALVIAIEKTQEMEEFRRILEAAFPSHADRNFPLNPHITITELRHHRSLKLARNLVQERLQNRDRSEPTKVGGVEIFYTKT